MINWYFRALDDNFRLLVAEMVKILAIIDMRAEKECFLQVANGDDTPLKYLKNMNSDNFFCFCCF